MRNEPTLTDAEAQLAIDAVRDKLRADGKAAAIAVVDSHGDLLAFLRVYGVGCTPIQIAMNKAYTAARQRVPTLDVGRDVLQRGFDISYYGDPRYVGWGGGIPVEHQGAVAGAVGVSGLSEQEDTHLAEIAVAAIQQKLKTVSKTEP